MQNMKIELGIERYEHLKDKSCYNHNYYKLESYGDWCNLPYSILLEECHEDENYFTFSLGKFNEKGEFVCVLEWDSDYGCNGIEDLFIKKLGD